MRRAVWKVGGRGAGTRVAAEEVKPAIKLYLHVLQPSARRSPAERSRDVPRKAVLEIDIPPRTDRLRVDLCLAGEIGVGKHRRRVSRLAEAVREVRAGWNRESVCGARETHRCVQRAHNGRVGRLAAGNTRPRAPGPVQVLARKAVSAEGKNLEIPLIDGCSCKSLECVSSCTTTVLGQPHCAWPADTQHRTRHARARWHRESSDRERGNLTVDSAKDVESPVVVGNSCRGSRRENVSQWRQGLGKPCPCSDVVFIEVVERSFERLCNTKASVMQRTHHLKRA